MKKLFLLLAMCASCILCAKEVFYVHGFLNKESTSFDKEKNLLREIFPEYKISIKPWNSSGSWDRDKIAAENHANTICCAIMNMSKAEQQKLIVIGHSLGGRCVAHLAAKLKEYNIKVERIILLGAAIADDASCLYDIGRVSQKTALNLYSFKDKALKDVMIRFDGDEPAGFSSIKGIDDRHVKEYNIKEFYVDEFTRWHVATSYLKALDCLNLSAL